MKPGVLVDLMPPVDILGAAGRERKTTEGPQPKPVFNLQPGMLSRKDADVTDKAQLAALGGRLEWKG
jgi:hypothetical protein